jgi:hypothetical protein
MGLVNTQVFIGTRCRLCRHKDARFINGWVQYFRGDSLLVQTEEGAGCEPGDAMYLEAYGPKVKGSAGAILVAVGLPEGEASGSAKLSLRLNEPLKVSTHNEASRVLVSGMEAQVSAAGSTFNAKVRDVSANGVGLLTDQELAKDSEITIVLNTAMGPIKATGKVRHVRKSSEGFRTGVELVGLSRLDGSRWKKLTGEAA